MDDQTFQKELAKYKVRKCTSCLNFIPITHELNEFFDFLIYIFVIYNFYLYRLYEELTITNLEIQLKLVQYHIDTKILIIFLEK